MTEAEQYMRRAIELAERGRHRVMPNPLVGCILVKEDEVVAEGWHDHIAVSYTHLTLPTILRV